MTEFVFDADGEEATDKLGAALAAAFACIEGPVVVALRGTLGAGKTRLVRSIAAAMEIPSEEVCSPTFTLIHEYHGSRSIYHLDAYRIRTDDEFRELGVEEMFDLDAVIIVEWADRVRGAMPDEFLQIDIEVTGDCSRRFIIRAAAMRLYEVLSVLNLALR
jgi:tRNA threonylcarbamoyladenosine biosynthesis protein TsaE